MVDLLRVLVVDDEVPLAEVVASYLQRDGFAVDLAHDGPSAVRQARQHPPGSWSCWTSCCPGLTVSRYAGSAFIHGRLHHHADHAG